jgi:DNA-binding GntR family transcriptional regulator
MSITNESDPRAYVRITDRLRREIAEGTYAPGTPAPSITTLCKEYGHARQTCARALRTLEAEGLLTRVPGLGYYVSVGAMTRVQNTDLRPIHGEIVRHGGDPGQ